MVIPLSQRRCLYTYSRLEAERYQRRHRSGDGDQEGSEPDAITEWNQRHWWDWASERYLEHITGRVYWEQFGVMYEGGVSACLRVASDNHEIEHFLDPAKANPAWAEACVATSEGYGSHHIKLVHHA